MLTWILSLALGFGLPSVVAVPVPDAALVAAAAPTVTLDAGTFTGAASGNVQKFLGIPFAKPPSVSLRFNLGLTNHCLSLVLATSASDCQYPSPLTVARSKLPPGVCPVHNKQSRCPLWMAWSGTPLTT